MSYKNRDDQIATMYKTLAAEFLEKESEGPALLTVTGINITRNRRDVTILFTVFPDQYQEQALRFTKRKRSEFREWIKPKIKNMAFCPIFDFAIDLGEKNRQKIDKLTSLLI